MASVKSNQSTTAGKSGKARSSAAGKKKSGSKTAGTEKKGSTRKSAASSGSKKPDGLRRRSAAPRRKEYVDYALVYEIIVWIMLALCVLLFISLLGFGGAVGRFFASVCFGLFGVMAWVFPFLLFFLTSFLISNSSSQIARIKAFAAVWIFIIMCGVTQMLLVGYNSGYLLTEYYQAGAAYQTGGGFAGGCLVSFFCPALGIVATWLVFFLMLIIALILITQRSIFASVKKGGKGVVNGAIKRRSLWKEWMLAQREKREKKLEEEELAGEPDPDTLYDPGESEYHILPKEKTPRMKRKVTGVTPSTRLMPQELQKGADAGGPEGNADTAHGGAGDADPDAYGDDLSDLKINGSFDMSGLEDIRTSHAQAPKPENSSGGTAAGSLPDHADPAGNDYPQEKKTDLLPRKARSERKTGKSSQGASFGDVFRKDDDLRRTSSGAAVFSSSSPDEIDEEEIERLNKQADDLIRKSAGAAGKGASSGGTKETSPARPPAKTESRGGKASGAETPADAGDVAGEIAIKQAQEAQRPPYVFPPLSLLDKPKNTGSGNTPEELRETAAKLQQVLKTFGVNVKVTNVTCGPSVTRYEMIPEMGVKVSKIVNLQDDLKLNLAVTDIRIEAPIPGKSAVGIEVPNKKSIPVLLRDLLESDVFKNHKSNLAYAVGKDISGRTIVSDIAKMPHLLIAGSTGSGKSVFINTLIMSIIYKAKPEDVKLIMVDPKVVELSVYNGIPHLFIPVVTDPKKAAGALNWAVAEMMKRYQKFAEVHVRDLKGYNQRVEALDDMPGKPEKMPQIVVIVDELADLMMVASSEVEDAIVRLTQLARAAGIHLVIATQRPSVDVITGLIKANMPSRIALAVSSGVDSRTILDQVGAEKLLGNGDMLFSPSNYKQPLRVQGAFISDEEVARVVDFLKQQEGFQSTQEMEERMQSVENAVSSTAAGGGSDTDELFEQAARFIIEKDKASIGMLQRWFKIGFNRAARIMDQLSDAGVVGPEEGTKPRKVLMSMEELDSYLSGDGS